MSIWTVLTSEENVPSHMCAQRRFRSPCASAQSARNLDSKDAITKTRLYNFDPLKPHFYIVKLGYTLFLLFLLKNIDCGYSLEPPRRGGSNEFPQSMFWAGIWKISEFILSEKFPYFGCEIFNIFEISVLSQWSFFIRRTKSLKRLHVCACWFESSLDSHVRRYAFSRSGP